MMTLTLSKFKLFLVMLIAGSLLSCEETDTVNQDILDIVPGGSITTSITGGPSGATFSLNNDEFPSYGCFEDLPEEDATSRTITLLVSGKQHGKVYYIKARATLSAATMEMIKENPGNQFSISNIESTVQIVDDTSYFYTGAPTGYMTFSNYGKIGEDVTIDFYLYTSITPGFTDMQGTVKTKFVLAEY